MPLCLLFATLASLLPSPPPPPQPHCTRAPPAHAPAQRGVAGGVSSRGAAGFGRRRGVGGTAAAPAGASADGGASGCRARRLVGGISCRGVRAAGTGGPWIGAQRGACGGPAASGGRVAAAAPRAAAIAGWARRIACCRGAPRARVQVRWSGRVERAATPLRTRRACACVCRRVKANNVRDGAFTGDGRASALVPCRRKAAALLRLAAAPSLPPAPAAVIAGLATSKSSTGRGLRAPAFVCSTLKQSACTTSQLRDQSKDTRLLFGKRMMGELLPPPPHGGGGCRLSGCTCGHWLTRCAAQSVTMWSAGRSHYRPPSQGRRMMLAGVTRPVPEREAVTAWP